jgi:dimethylamine/trimethylamine dehydrogenase
MARDPKYDILFEPVRIGPKVMRNRFYQTPHCSGLGNEYPGAQAHLRGMKAEGGWAVVNTEYCSIHPESDDRPWIPARLWDDGDVKNLALMCDKVHEHGSLAGVELHFGGAHHTGYETRLPARAVSQIPSETFWMRACYEISKEEIRELQGFYAAAARRARAAGFDLILVYGAEASPITQQFLMPYFNKRRDEYGGSFENRARFFRETIEVVREAVGDDCAIGVRFSIDTMREDDLGIRVGEDGIRFVEHVDHLVDLWDIQVGGPTVGEWLDAAGASRFREENFQKPWVEQVRPHTAKPIVGVGRFTNPDTMVSAIRSGQLDIIGAARPSIADPFLPRKIEEGRFDEIRECIGCNVCGSRFNQGGMRIICTQNATIAEEYRRGWHPEIFEPARNGSLDVLVVGAGPAGLECALVLAKRGIRRVHLVDAEAEIGGSLRWMSRLPGLGEWARVIDYRRIQLGKLKNVEVLTGVRLDRRDALEYGADIVVVATGSFWSRDGLNAATHLPVEGADASLPYVFTPEQIELEGKELSGQRVLVYDADGYFMASSLAEKLARAGKRVTIVSPFLQIAPFMFYTGEGRYMERLLRSLGVSFIPSHTLLRVADTRVTGAAVGEADRPVEWSADALVLVTQRLSNDLLYRELVADRDALEERGIRGVFRIGDCLAPRLVADAVFDGHRLAREIDSPDPATPLPYIREHRILESTDEEYDVLLRTESASHRPSTTLKRRRLSAS